MYGNTTYNNGDRAILRGKINHENNGGKPIRINVHDIMWEKQIVSL